MFGGWFAIFAVNYMVYRCARATHRRRLLWVAISWVLIFGVGFVVATIAAVCMMLQSGQIPTEQAMAKNLVAPSALGMLIGGIVSVVLANRPIAERLVEAETAGI
jgi:formate/nitrite transporter FocA (FNT family)